MAMAAVAPAEEYVAKIYSVPSPYSKLVVEGAGANGMMTGTILAAGTTHAATLTDQGLRDINAVIGAISRIYDSWGGTYHVGHSQVFGNDFHAFLWIGGSQAYDLHPTSITSDESAATGVDGNFQCGWYHDALGNRRPCLWSRTALSFKPLSAPGFPEAIPTSVDSTNVAGNTVLTVGNVGANTEPDKYQAVYWKGFAQPETAVRLSPTGFDESQALACDYPLVGGYFRGVSTFTYRQAALWNVADATVKNLNPSGVFRGTRITAMSNGVQVGYGTSVTTPNRNQAILWHGQASTWTNLHSKLPYPYNLWNSFAMDIDAQGNVIGYIVQPTTLTERPVVWYREPAL
jgi:hypothetical protein